MTDEDIDASKAPLMDHLIELRARLIRAVIAFMVAFLGCFYFSRGIYNVLTEPYVRVVGAENAKLIATHFLEQFYTNIQLSMFGAGVIAFPIIAQQIYKFVAPGLYKHEKRAFFPYLIATPIFFSFAIASSRSLSPVASVSSNWLPMITSTSGHCASVPSALSNASRFSIWSRLDRTGSFQPV